MSRMSRKQRMKAKAIDFFNAGQQTAKEWIVEHDARFHDLVDRILSSPNERSANQLGAATIKSLVVLVILGLTIVLALGPVYASVGQESSYVPSKLVKDSRMLVVAAGEGGWPGGWGGIGKPSRSPRSPQSNVGGAPRDSGGSTGTADPSTRPPTTNRETQEIGGPSR